MKKSRQMSDLKVGQVWTLTNCHNYTTTYTIVSMTEKRIRCTEARSGTHLFIMAPSNLNTFTLIQS